MSKSSFNIHFPFPIKIKLHRAKEYTMKPTNPEKPIIML